MEPPPAESMPQRVAWRRVLIEGGVIVASILLAFAIDAWWGQRVAARQTRQALLAMQAELVENKAYFNDAVEVWQRSEDAGFALLQRTGPNVSVEDPEAVVALIGDLMLRPDTKPPSTGAAMSLVSEGTLSRVRSRELRQSLSMWPSYIEGQQELMNVFSNAALLWQRLLLYVPSLDFDRVNGMASVPEVREAFASRATTASRFPSDWSGLLSDRQFESGVTERTMGAVSGGHFASETIGRIEDLLALIERELQ